MGDELADVHAEIATVKKALRENGSFLGMTGETLQRYFLQLNEKENLFLTKQVNSMPKGGGDHHLGGAMLDAGKPVGGGGYSNSAAPVPVARPPPSGDVKSFDRDSMASVVAHMAEYEASAGEAAKALRALASLAYANAKQVGEHPDILPQALRLLSLHPAEENVQVNGMRALCNMAYDNDVALNRLSSPAAVGAFVGAMARKPNSKEIGAKASEAIARVVAAEVGPESGATPAVPADRGPLRALFTVVAHDDVAGREVVVQLIQQLVSNEVTTAELLVQRLIDISEACKESGPAAASWLMLAKQVAMAEIATMSEGLITRGAIASAASVMVAQHSHGPTQLAGIEAMSGLVGSRWIGLQAFAGVKGISRIEEAMKAHPDEPVLQTKGIRALASGIQWPEDIQSKASYNYRHGVELTKAAMAKHGENEDLQVAALEALSKYLDRMKCVEEVKQEGGTGLVKAVMMRHSGVEKVKVCGGNILEALGEKNWSPKGQSA